MASSSSSNSSSTLPPSSSSPPAAAPPLVLQDASLPPVAHDILLVAARGGATPRAPCWAMRQAGRYLPEFRALRQRHSFWEMTRSPALCCEATLQPLRRFPALLDAVVIFSDILIVPQAMGMEVQMRPGPFFPRPICAPEDLGPPLGPGLGRGDDACAGGAVGDGGASEAPVVVLRPGAARLAEAFGPLYAAIALTRRTAAAEGKAVPVIGFCGGPWTLMAYMVGGGAAAPASASASAADASSPPQPPNPAALKDDGSHERARLWLLAYPAASHALLGALADVCVELLLGQWRAGASVLQVFESSAGDLPPALFNDFALPYLERIAAAVRARTPPVAAGGPPLIAFARNAHQAGVLEALCVSQFDAMSLDWLTDPAEACARVRAACARAGGPDGAPPRQPKALQGNLDPGALHLAPRALALATAAMLRGFGSHALVANLGHGMHPSHSPAQLARFFEAVHALSAAARARRAGASEQEAAAEEAAIVERLATQEPRMVVPREYRAGGAGAPASAPPVASAAPPAPAPAASLPPPSSSSHSSRVLMNDVGDVVAEATRGLLATRPDLVRLRDARAPRTTIVALRAADRPAVGVALVSGGGAGHEPMHGGLVARGLLTAAVSGDVFASPTAAAVLAAVRSVAAGGRVGVLLVVKNYGGDRLAFGLAAESARREGIAVETVLVADDAAVDGGPVTGRRGLAGTVLVHKVAGALAARGGARASLRAVAARARSVAGRLATVGASFGTCSVPGSQAPSARLSGGSGPGAAVGEIGLGIHGEAGAESLASMPTADALADRLVAALAAHLRAGAGAGAGEGGAGGDAPPTPVALLVNSLGGVSGLELALFTDAALRACARSRARSRSPASPGGSGGSGGSGGLGGGLLPRVVMSGSLCTSLDARGVSLTALALTGAGTAGSGAGAGASASAEAGAGAGAEWAEEASDEELLLDPTQCPAWPGFARVVDAPAAQQQQEEEVADAPPAATAASAAALGASGAGCAGGPRLPAALVLSALALAASRTAAAEGEISRLDAAAGDGDAGLTAVAITRAAAEAAAALASAGVASSGAAAGDAAAPARGEIGLVDLLRAVGDAVAAAAGGTSGVLYAIALRAAEAAVAGAVAGAGGGASASGGAGVASDAAAVGLRTAFEAGVAAICAHGGARPGDRTMIDALAPAARALAGGGGAAAVAEAAEAGAHATADMAPRAGRASYVPAASCRGLPDAGAAAASIFFRAVADAAAPK